MSVRRIMRRTEERREDFAVVELQGNLPYRVSAEQIQMRGGKNSLREQDP